MPKQSKNPLDPDQSFTTQEAVWPQYDTEETPFVCPIMDCGRISENGYAMVKHLSGFHKKDMEGMESGKRVFRCVFTPCTMYNQQYTNLQSHFYSHLNIEPCECPHIEGIIRNTNEADPEEFKLVMCPFKTRHAASVTRHRRQKHGYKPAVGRSGRARALGENFDQRVLNIRIFRLPGISDARQERRELALRRDIVLGAQANQRTIDEEIENITRSRPEYTERTDGLPWPIAPKPYRSLKTARPPLVIEEVPLAAYESLSGYSLQPEVDFPIVPCLSQRLPPCVSPQPIDYAQPQYDSFEFLSGYSLQPEVDYLIVPFLSQKLPCLRPSAALQPIDYAQPQYNSYEVPQLAAGSMSNYVESALVESCPALSDLSLPSRRATPAPSARSSSPATFRLSSQDADFSVAAPSDGLSKVGLPSLVNTNLSPASPVASQRLGPPCIPSGSGSGSGSNPRTHLFVPFPVARYNTPWPPIATTGTQPSLTGAFRYMGSTNWQ